MSWFKKSRKAPAEVFDEGWQFYPRATGLEPPGTVFRIDGQRRRYIVEMLEVAGHKGVEVSARLRKSIQSTLSVFLRFIGLQNLKPGAALDSLSTFDFELGAAERELLTDAALDAPLAALLARLPYRADNRYFIIREAISATAMTYRLTQRHVADIGGTAALAGVLDAEAKVRLESEGFCELSQAFPERLRVTFLPEEIRPVRAGLAGERPALGLVPVKEPLIWQEERDE